jgi:DNA-binding response OmpR family regulator
MKVALVLEKDRHSYQKVSELLKWFGYMPVPTWTPQEALCAASAISFDIIVTCTATIPEDRRSLTGELKRIASKAIVLLICDKDDESNKAAIWKYPGTSAIIIRPPSVDAFRRVLEFGIDGCGLQAVHVPVAEERRKNTLA